MFLSDILCWYGIAVILSENEDEELDEIICRRLVTP